MKNIATIAVVILAFAGLAYAGDSATLITSGQLGVAASNSGPQRLPRIVLRVGYFIGSTKATQSISWTQPAYQENASYAVGYDLNKANSFSGALGYRFSPAVGVEAGFDLASRDLGASPSASVPHPLYFNSPRTAEATRNSRLKETSLSLSLVYSALFGKFGLDVLAGPAYLSSSADLVSGINFTESAYPYDTVSISSQSSKQSKSSFGLHVGAGFNFFVSRNVALFLGARFISGKATYAAGDLPSVSFGLGGLKLGGGLKFAL